MRLRAITMNERVVSTMLRQFTYGVITITPGGPAFLFSVRSGERISEKLATSVYDLAEKHGRATRGGPIEELRNDLNPRYKLSATSPGGIVFGAESASRISAEVAQDVASLSERFE